MLPSFEPIKFYATPETLAHLSQIASARTVRRTLNQLLFELLISPLRYVYEEPLDYTVRREIKLLEYSSLNNLIML